MLPNILININYNQIIFLLINVFYLVVFSLILLHNNNCFVTSQSHSNRDLFLFACGICLSFSNVDVRIIRKRLNFVCLRIRVRHRELHHFILTCIVIVILKLLSRWSASQKWATWQPRRSNPSGPGSPHDTTTRSRASRTHRLCAGSTATSRNTCSRSPDFRTARCGAFCWSDGSWSGCCSASARSRFVRWPPRGERTTRPNSRSRRSASWRAPDATRSRERSSSRPWSNAFPGPRPSSRSSRRNSGSRMTPWTLRSP